MDSYLQHQFDEVRLDSSRKTIAVIDSCACGISVVKSLIPILGAYNVIYLADTQYNPLGLKTPEQLSAIVQSWINLTYGRNRKVADVVVMACNTASIAYLDTGMIPRPGVKVVTLIDSFEHMLQETQNHIRNKQVGIMGTYRTIASGFYQKLLQKYEPKRIVNIVATKSEHAIATAYYKTPEGREEIAAEIGLYIHDEIQTMLLACTCFNCIKDQITDKLESVTSLFDPADSLQSVLKLHLQDDDFPPKQLSDISFVNTGGKAWSVTCEKLSGEILGRTVPFQNVSIDRDIS